MTIDAFLLANERGVEVRFIPLGGRITSIHVPDRRGRIADVTLGYDSLDAYMADARYFGALVGRYANRIARGRFTLDGMAYSLPINDPPNHLHGGPRGFHCREWAVGRFRRGGVDGAELRCEIAAGDDGYPGSLSVRVTYSLDDDNQLRVEYHATTDAPTIVNFTQHSYFNLAGSDVGDILDHELTVGADRITLVDQTLIPTGGLLDVAGTPFDFTRGTRIGAHIAAANEQLRVAHGYDHNFVLRDGNQGALAFAARLADPASGRVLEIHTTEPGLQLYTGNHVDHGAPGKGGRSYPRHAGVALETQHFPDSPNHPSFPSTVLRPGQEFRSTTVYRFSWA
ncbi:MAG: aldose epimerase family protein [Gemmatimonadales bacterium]